MHTSSAGMSSKNKRSSSRSSFSSRSHGAGVRGYTPAGYGRASLRPGSASAGTLFGGTLLFQGGAVKVDIDPTMLPTRTQEKEAIKKLNDRFASFIDKVRFLEQQKTVLEAQWKALQERGSASLHLDNLFEPYVALLRQHLDELALGQPRLESELQQMQGAVEDLRCKYEGEITTHSQMENEFVVVKKEVDESYLMKVELEGILDGLTEDISFYKDLFSEEMHQLESQIRDTSLYIEVDTRRNLDIGGLIADVRAQYETIAAKSKVEAEEFYKEKFVSINASAGRNEEELRLIKHEINESLRQLQRVKAEIEALKKQQAHLEMAIAETEERGEMDIRGAKETMSHLENQLQCTKQEMAKHVRDYQELMNVKLALDIEIATYRKLLEGEECRLGVLHSAFISGGLTHGTSSHNPSGGYFSQEASHSKALGFHSSGNAFGSHGSSFAQAVQSPHSAQSKKTVVIKTIETKDGHVVSESSEVVEQ
uniref:keratin, type II cytoskeletal 8-like n=1 Tax=Myxine glutinosa TaxID=7769 RepID=UPI00358FC816